MVKQSGRMNKFWICRGSAIEYIVRKHRSGDAAMVTWSNLLEILNGREGGVN